MKMTARRLETQGKSRFAELFERVYPDGADAELRPRDHRTAVRARVRVFETRGNEVLSRCRDCGKHFFISESSIVNALSSNQTISCSSCGRSGSLLPVYKRKKPAESGPVN
jgi:uncharacterized protein with PIN domain